jgi:hypothetical protein
MSPKNQDDRQDGRRRSAAYLARNKIRRAEAGQRVRPLTETQFAALNDEERRQAIALGLYKG